MAKLDQFQELTSKERQHRYFSEDFKKQKVKELEKNLVTVSKISKAYQVTRTAVYKWLDKYSIHRQKQIKQVIEMESDTRKVEALKDRIKELEQIIGQKQVQIDFQEKMLEIASEEVGFDIKKKYGTQPSSGTGSTGENTQKS